ncbi:ATP-binding protein, partial [Flavobacterium sp.]|uniref:sensor histidine kinase n=1 Tax=Flavobacterium sp. TaxID=239 RepID=UPI00262ABB9D
DDKIDWNSIDNLVKINLYRILQESFQNINKYAQASQIEVVFQQKENTIALKIQDNGQGFDVHKKKKGIGLENMQSRVSSLKGKFEIDSKKGIGTTLTINIPKLYT